MGKQTVKRTTQIISSIKNYPKVDVIKEEAIKLPD